MTLAYIEGEAITQYPVSRGDVRKRYPNVSFPRNLESQDLTRYGVVTVDLKPQPVFDPKVERISEGPPAKEGDRWTQQWVLTPLSTEELQILEAAAADAARAERNRRLTESDWTQLGDSPVQPVNEWRAYRQALRDITKLPGYPHNITWPDPPSSTTR